MQINVKRSNLLRFYSLFCNAYPATLSSSYFSVSLDDFFLLGKVVSSALTKKVTLSIDQDDHTPICLCFYESEMLDKNVLQSVLDALDQQAAMNNGAVINFKLTNGLAVLALLESLLVDKNLPLKMQPHQELIVLERLFAIRKKLGYSNFDNLVVSKISFSLKTGDIATVADNSGAKTVQILSQVEPMVYIVKVVKTKFGNQHKFPHGKKYAAVLLHDLLLDADFSNEVCLFEYFGGITQPLFTSVFYKGRVIPKDVLNYQKIIDSCLFL